MNSAPEIKGWCPGALRPMPSGDGLLLRAKIVGPRLSAQQALAIAEISLSCGNGLLDLSQRAQLQLRGVREETLQRAQRGLQDAGLLPNAEIESVLNILAPPLAVLDASPAFDAQDFVDQLSARISRDPSLRKLPGKFCFLIDDGADPGLAGSNADIRLEALRNSVSKHIAIVVDCARDCAVVVSMQKAVETALALARAFTRLRRGREFELRRMHAVVQAFGVEALRQTTGLAFEPYSSECRDAALSDVFGVHARGAQWFVGIGAAFGRWRAQDLAWLAERAIADGAAELRLSPWRAILIPAPSQAAAKAIIAGAAERDLIVDGDDPRLFVAACPGAPECPQAHGATRATAERLAFIARGLAQSGAGPGVHVSGCSKGCAMPRVAHATIVANGDGFDLVLDGRADDPPLKRDATLQEIEALLNASTRKSINPEARSREAPCPAR
jgi:precorrin-3B synthase